MAGQPLRTISAPNHLPCSLSRRPNRRRYCRAFRTVGQFDRLPIGILVYRLNSLIYANRAFLAWTGYSTLKR
jgi:hypothetical protein